MLAVAALLKSSGFSIPDVITTVYVRDDPGASCEKTAHDISVNITYVDPGFWRSRALRACKILYWRSKRGYGLWGWL